MSRRIITALLLLVVMAFPCAGAKIYLRVDLQDSQPKVIKFSDGTYGGLTVELMRLIEQNSEYRFIFSDAFMPTPRIEFNLENNLADLHFGFGVTKARQKKFIFAGKLYEIRFVMIQKVSDDIEIKNINDVRKLGRNGIVLVNSGTNTVEYLSKDLNLTVDDGAGTIHQNLDKLLAGRGRFYVYNNLAVFYEMKSPDYTGKFKLVPVKLDKIDHYMMFSRKTPDYVIQGLVKTVDKLKVTGEWNKITSKYLE